MTLEVRFNATGVWGVYVDGRLLSEHHSHQTACQAAQEYVRAVTR